MKRLWMALLLLPQTLWAAETYDLDPTHTYANFFISHSGFSMMHGRFNRTEGSVVVDRSGTGSSVQAAIDAASLDTGLEARDKVLRGSSFLDVAHHAELRYQSTAVRFTGDASAEVDGELSLHGVTRAVPLKVSRIACGVHPLKRVWTCGFSATATIKRSDFGMTSFASSVGDEIELRIEAEGERRAVNTGPRR